MYLGLKSKKSSISPLVKPKDPKSKDHELKDSKPSSFSPIDDLPEIRVSSLSPNKNEDTLSEPDNNNLLERVKELESQVDELKRNLASINEMLKNLTSTEDDQIME